MAAWCALQLPTPLGAPDAAYRQHGSRQVKRKSSERHVELGGLAAGAGGEHEAAAEDGSASGLTHAVTHAERRHHLKQQQQQHQLAPLAREPATGSTTPEPAAPQEQGCLTSPGAAAAPGVAGSSGGTAALWAGAVGAMAEGARATAEGWRYVSSPANRDVAALVMMKCAAALVWGERGCLGGVCGAWSGEEGGQWAGCGKVVRAFDKPIFQHARVELAAPCCHPSCVPCNAVPATWTALPTLLPLAGAVDILNVRFSEMPSMQALGDSSATLGYIFAAGGRPARRRPRHAECGSAYPQARRATWRPSRQRQHAPLCPPALAPD